MLRGITAMNHKRLYIGDLGPNVTEQDLLDLLTQVGEVDSLILNRPAEVGVHAFAIAEMRTPEAARAAVKRYNQTVLDGYRLLIYTIPPRIARRE